MIGRIQTAALAVVLALGLATAASAASVRVDTSPTGTANEFLIEVFVTLDQDRTLATVDVGIEAAGATFANITDEGTFFEGAFFGPANSILPGDIAFFSASSLTGAPLTPADATVLLGTVVATTSGETDLIISTSALYQISEPDGTVINDPGQPQGSVLASIGGEVVVPEPATLVLLGLALSGLSLRRR